MGINRRSISNRMGWDIVSGPEIGHWVAKWLDRGFFENRSVALGLKKNNKIIAGVIYENFNHASIWCHIAIIEKITPKFLSAIFDYPFNIAQIEKIIAPVGSDNDESIKLVKNMGFEEEGRIKNARPHGDIIFFTLCRDKCRFLNKRYSKRIQ